MTVVSALVTIQSTKMPNATLIRSIHLQQLHIQFLRNDVGNDSENHRSEISQVLQHGFVSESKKKIIQIGFAATFKTETPWSAL